MAYARMPFARFMMVKSGAVQTEYAFLIAFISIIAAVGMVVMGQDLLEYFQGLGASIANGSTPTPDPFTLTTLEKVGIDQFVQAPIFTVIILCFFAIVEGKGLGFAQEQVRTELKGILIKNWAVFLPATAINIGFCPPELRVLFLNCVFFGWVVYLSLFLNDGDAPAEEAR